MVRTILETPPVALMVAEEVFDAYAWCQSRTLAWLRTEGWERDAPLTAANPPGMVFVMKAPLPFLPRELASLHAPRFGLEGEWVLAPYGIDDATDELYARRIPPESALFLATDSLAGLFWGLHDWAHFHNHGPFVLRAATELSCDVTALAWLWLNRESVGIDTSGWERLREAAVRISVSRFHDEGRTLDHGILEASAVRALVEGHP